MTVALLTIAVFLAYLSFCAFKSTMCSCYEKTSNVQFVGLLMATFGGLVGSLTVFALALGA